MLKKLVWFIWIFVLVSGGVWAYLQMSNSGWDILTTSVLIGVGLFNVGTFVYAFLSRKWTVDYRPNIYPDHPELSTSEFWNRVERGQIKPK